MSSCAGLFLTQALARAEHRSLRGQHGGKVRKTHCGFYVIENGLRPTADEMGLVPEPRAANVTHEVLPPFLMRHGARPRFQGIEIASVLAHPYV